MADLSNIEGDAVLSALFGLGAAHSLGIAEIKLLDIGLGTEFYSVAGTSVEWASALSILGLLGVFALNSPDLEGMKLEAKILAASTLGIVAVGAISPSTIDPLTVTGGSVATAGIVWAIEAGGFWSIATADS
jgi:hypothetical protein